MNPQSIFDRPNPFQMDLRVLRCPDDMGAITIDGYQLEPDENHLVQVPQLMVDRLKPHGLVPLSTAELAKLKTAAKK